MAKKLIALGALFLITTGCNLADRVGRLEKQTSELRAEVEKGRTGAEYDLQAKCSKDARAWFNDSWSRDKDTILLDFRNHYNESQNKCFILVEYHYNSHFAGDIPPEKFEEYLLYVRDAGRALLRAASKL